MIGTEQPLSCAGFYTLSSSPGPAAVREIRKIVCLHNTQRMCLLAVTCRKVANRVVLASSRHPGKLSFTSNYFPLDFNPLSPVVLENDSPCTFTFYLCFSTGVETFSPYTLRLNQPTAASLPLFPKLTSCR